MRLTTLTGYSDKISAKAGDTIRFMVSSENGEAYQAQLVRVICGDLNPAGPGYREAEIDSPINRTYPGRHQRIHAGSYAVVPGGGALSGPSAFTVQAAIYPTKPGSREQAILSLWSAEGGAGFELLLSADGAPALRLGDGAGGIETIATGRALRPYEWAFLAAAYDPVTRRAWLHQSARATYLVEPIAATVEQAVGIVPTPAADAALLMAARAAGADGTSRLSTEAHYNGRIEAPRLFGRALTLAEAAEAAARTVPAHLRPDLLGAWDFSLEIPTTRIVDVSGNGLDGHTVNLPTRAVTGQAWTGADMRWTTSPHEYAAIHFHDDDLYDADWASDFALTVPDDLPSGAYAVRVRAGASEDYLPFFVRRPLGRPTAKILYLAPTATYLAYANLSVYLSPGAELLGNRLVAIQPWEEYLNAHPELGASLYDLHTDGTGICISSRLRPVLNMRPKVLTPTAGHGSMLWAYNADTHLIDWLDAQGYQFDVATDEDLHAEGAALLRDYRVVLTGTHPEYYSATMLQAMQDYTTRGGRLMYMGGNGFYWRIAYHPTLPGVIEIRRAEDGTRAWVAKPGEYYKSFTGEYGGLWRRQDRPPQKLVGTGFIAQGFDFGAGYHRTDASTDPRVAFAFEGIGRDEPIGDFGLITGGAAGLEVDIADRSLGTPPHALVVAVSDELPDTFLLVNEEQTIATPDTLGTTNPRIRSEIVFFETGYGGAVFSFSSMAWCGSLSHARYDNNVSRITANVLNRVLSDEPL